MDMDENEMLDRIQKGFDAAMRKAFLDPNNADDYKAFRDWLIRSVKANPEGRVVDLDIVASKAAAFRRVEKVHSGEINNPTSMIRAGYTAQNAEKESASVEPDKETKSATPYNLISLGYARHETERTTKDE